MKFCEYGKENSTSIMLLAGNLMTHRQYKLLVPMLNKAYHIITVSFDGFDETGETTYTTAKKQAEKLASYIRKHLNGRIDLVYAESLGGASAVYLTRSKTISVGGIIISGTSYWNLGIFDIFGKNTPYKIPYGIRAKAKKEGIEFYKRVEKWEPRTDIPIACWYGENEANMKKAIITLKKAFPNIEIHPFEGLGHGEIVNNEKLLIRDMEDFMVRNQIIQGCAYASYFENKKDWTAKISKDAMRIAKRCIKKEPMPSSLEAEFQKNGMEHLLKDVYTRTAELVQENMYVDKVQWAHLEQILPCIAFYEVLVKESESKDAALDLYGQWCLLKIEKMAKIIPVVMMMPGLYKLMPGLMNMMLGSLFGEKAGFKSQNVSTDNGFAVDMTVCPYVEMCRKYDCLEIAQYFCKSDDLCYGNMHPNLVWGRTKTLGMGDDCCDFKLYVK